MATKQIIGMVDVRERERNESKICCGKIFEAKITWLIRTSHMTMLITCLVFTRHVTIF